MTYPNTSRFHRPDFTTTDKLIQPSCLFQINDLNDCTIPTFELTDEQCENPIEFIESVYDQARSYGAIKVKLSSKYQNILNSNIQLNNNISFCPTSLNQPRFNEDEISSFAKIIKNHWNIDLTEIENVSNLEQDHKPTSNSQSQTTNHEISNSRPILSDLGHDITAAKPDPVSHSVSTQPEPSPQKLNNDNQPDEHVGPEFKQEEIKPESSISEKQLEDMKCNVDQPETMPDDLQLQPHTGIDHSVGDIDDVHWKLKLNDPNLDAMEVDGIKSTSIEQSPSKLEGITPEIQPVAAPVAAPVDDELFVNQVPQLANELEDKEQEKVKSETIDETEPNGKENDSQTLVPLIKNQRLDLLKLYNYVHVFGGYQKVNKQNLWHQICIELQIDTSYADLINKTYLKVLYPLESELQACLHSKPDNDFQLAEISSSQNIHGKRLIEEGLPEPKRPHNLKQPPVIESSPPFPRSIKSKLLKGFPLKSLKIESKQSKTLSSKNYINHILKLLVENNELFQDTRTSSNRMKLNDFIKRDSLVQEYIETFKLNFENESLLYSQMDNILTNFLNDSKIDLKVGNLSSNSTNFGFIKTNGMNRNENKSYEDFLRNKLCPWNLHNLPILPNSLLGSMFETDLNNPEIAVPRLNIEGTLTLDNWSYQDHFTQLANYHLMGSDKIWYFVPELEFSKFEKLVNELNMEVRNQKPECRFQLANESLQKIMKPTTFYDQVVFITPKMLKEKGIIYHKVVQSTGEFIIQYPKSYATSTSLGFNITEEVNFATNCWLNYALDAEENLAARGIIPNFLIFKMLINLIQVFDSGKSIGYGSDVYFKIKYMYEEICSKELELRQEIRKLKIKETIVDEKYVSFADAVTDIDLKSGFPSRVTITDRKDKSKVSMSLDYFLEVKETLMNSKNFLIQLNLYYSDEKLKNYLKIISNYSVDFKKWLEDYKATMKTTEQLSLKTYKSILTEGEKIASAVESVADKSCDTYIKFKRTLANLKHFIANSNLFIEECQNILAIKHQQRIRNNTEYQKASLRDLVKLIDKIASLNFSSTETDQILELQQEIENFDKASRVLISKKNKTTQEFNDLINLGESFGIEIPSLNFISRIRDRIKWIKVFGLIEKGADPFSDKKEVFSLQNLREFYNEGKRILSGEDQDLFESIQIVVNNSEKFDKEVSEFLNYEFVDDIDLKTLDRIADRIRLEKIFISSDNYNELSKLHLNSHLITQLQDFKTAQNKFHYAEVKQLQNSLGENGLRFNSDVMAKELNPVENWVQSIWDIVKDVSIVSTMDKTVDLDHLNLRLSLNTPLIEKLYQINHKAEYSFSAEDTFEKSSAYLLKYNKDDNVETKEPPIYCVCREYEFGTMIECDSCNEWYHVICVNEDQQDTDEGNYVCPVCKFIDSNEKLDKFLKRQFRMKTMSTFRKEGDGLRVYAANEKNALGELHDQCVGFQARIQSTIDSIKKDNDKSLELKIDYLKFVIRKMYGSGILMTDQLKNALKLVRDYAKELNPPPIEPTNLNQIGPISTEPYVNDSTAFGNLLAAATMEIAINVNQESNNTPNSFLSDMVKPKFIYQNINYVPNESIKSETDSQINSDSSGLLVSREPPQNFTNENGLQSRQTNSVDKLKNSDDGPKSNITEYKPNADVPMNIPIAERIPEPTIGDLPTSLVTEKNLDPLSSTAQTVIDNVGNGGQGNDIPTASSVSEPKTKISSKDVPIKSGDVTTTNEPSLHQVDESKKQFTPHIQDFPVGKPLITNSMTSPQNVSANPNIAVIPTGDSSHNLINQDDSIDPSLQ